MYPIRSTAPTEASAAQAPAGDTVGTDPAAFPGILSGVRRAPGNDAQENGRAVQRLMAGGEGDVGLEMKEGKREAEIASLLRGGRLRTVDGKGEGRTKVVLVGEDGATKDGEKGSAPPASADTVKQMLLLVMGRDGNLRQKVGEGTRGGEQQGNPGQSRGGGQSSGKTSGGAKQTVLLVRGMGRAETGGPQGAETRGVKQGQPRGTSASVLRSSGAEGDRGKRVQVLSSGGAGEGKAGPKTEGQASVKGRTVTKQMPNGGRSGSPSQMAQRGSRSGGQGSTPSKPGPGRQARGRADQQERQGHQKGRKHRQGTARRATRAMSAGKTVILGREMGAAQPGGPQGAEKQGPKTQGVRQGLASGAGKGKAGPKTEGQASAKGKTVTKQMPNGGRSGSPSQAAQRGARSGGQGSTPSEAGPGRAGRTARRQSAANGLNLDAQVRGEADRSPEDALKRGAEAASTKKNASGKESAQGRAAALFSGKSRAADPGRGREAIREAPSEGRSARTTRDGQARGRQAQGRAGQQGGQGHQKGGSHRQGAGQNGQGQNGQGGGTKNGPGFQALASSSASTSGESDAQTLRASLTRDGTSTGSGTQGTDGKSASPSGSTPNSATAKSNGRPGGGSAPPRTMPSAWLNAAKQGPLRTAELAGGWKALEMSLGEDKGMMTVKARQGQEQTAVSVGFSDARVQAQVTANARQLQEALQSQYGTDVDLSFGGGGPNDSDREAPEGTKADRALARTAGDDTADEEATGTSSLRSRGRREWVG